MRTSHRRFASRSFSKRRKSGFEQSSNCLGFRGKSTGTQRAPAQVWNLRQNDNDFKTRRRILMSNYTHQTAPIQFVEANGIRFAYRRFGKTGGVPIVFNQHYIGTMDYWDPT